MQDQSFPIISVIVLNYNGGPWIEKCIASLQNQTLKEPFEIVFADNLSTDKSDLSAEELLRAVPNARFIQHGANLGFCEGNNRAARAARGQFFLFLNNDAWLEADCLDQLMRGVREEMADAACPLILNYEDNSFQSIGAEGFDIFGLPSARRRLICKGKVLMPEGCAYFISSAAFHRLGGFDTTFFMYSDEYDLSWRLWIAGYKGIRIPEARVHHRGAANVNPAGGGTMIEFRTSDSKRFYANRNALLVLLKNSQHFLFLTVFLQLILLGCEAIVSLVLIRRWSYIRRAYADAITGCWHLRSHIGEERRKLGSLRQRSDWAMLQFLTWRLNRWDEVKRMFAFGLPKVARK
ncbi:MAG TPA: glycosyltransferase family 2 protein [Verrucomicrobiae bacterium]|jgi:GT2 family glycosyltransferase|nr:glycosyltransferase family 2 protein [Verrucomicrobiae bacterium]